MYYLDPFQYLIGGLISRALWDVEVKCESDEYAVFDPPEGMTCQSYMSAFLSEEPLATWIIPMLQATVNIASFRREVIISRP